MFLKLKNAIFPFFGKKKLAASASFAAGAARFVIYPLDFVREQFEKGLVPPGMGTYRMIKEIVNKSGMRGLFTGAKSKLINQMVSSGLCLGGYDAIKHTSLQIGEDDQDGYSLAARVGAGIAAGGTATFSTIPRPIGHKGIITINLYEAIKEYRREYKKTQSVFNKHIFLRHLKNQTSQLCQNGFITMCEVVSYDIIKDVLINNYMMKDEFILHSISAILCGMFAVLTTGPFYSIRNHLFNAPPKKYSTVKECIIDMYRTNGIRTYYPGFKANIVRLLIFNFVLWNTFEQLKGIYPKLCKLF